MVTMRLVELRQTKSMCMLSKYIDKMTDDACLDVMIYFMQIISPSMAMSNNRAKTLSIIIIHVLIRMDSCIKSMIKCVQYLYGV